MANKACKDKKKHPWWSYLLWVLGALAALVALVLLGARLYFRIPVSSYYRVSERGFLIPDCGRGFVAQGIAYDEQSGRFLVNGYQKDNIASPIYVIAPGAKKPDKTIRMALPDGTGYTGHAGGIAIYGDYIYVADGGGHRLLVFSSQSVYDAADGSSVAAIGVFDTAVSDTDYIGPAFVTVDGNRLVTGEFYRNPNYPTPESHKFTTLAGDYQQALAVEYELDEQAQYGIVPVPVRAYTLPELAQGMCFDGGKIYVSTSWGTALSHIYQYDEAGLQLQGNIALLGVEIPLYALDSAALLVDGVIAPMSEEIEIVDGRLYTMCESASNKYIFGKFTSAKWCYATDVEAFFQHVE
ncbi:MAG: hypothetical protein NC389_12580 [Acetatifactor muris]|nr:hypothetical protein [Acetatifactor muris]